MAQTLVLLSYAGVLLLELCFIVATSSQELGAIWSVSDFLADAIFRTCRLFHTRLESSIPFISFAWGRKIEGRQNPCDEKQSGFAKLGHS
jgi:hypothetical protein